ncbi:MAG: bacillithiol biosynthesis deacetylase BshB1 [Ignavibacteriae bacterium]|nr:bacillithiol biosynthesis deacetylase BshB1 [Ignavibacteriota bacterium]
MKPELTNIDVLFAGAHPDDIELSAGGTVANLTLEGKKVVIVDFTRGELGTRGSGATRIKESQEAANILGVHERINLRLPDGYIKADDESILKAIRFIRKYRPKIVVMNPEYERHPDHEAVHKIIRSAMFKSGLIRIITKDNGKKQEPFRTRTMLSYQQAYSFHKNPDLIVDISDTFEIKMNAIKAYSSQVYVAGKSDPNGPVTRLSRPEFLEELKSRAIYFGTLIGCRYAEPFLSIELVGLKSLSAMLLKEKKLTK